MYFDFVIWIDDHSNRAFEKYSVELSQKSLKNDKKELTFQFNTFDRLKVQLNQTKDLPLAHDRRQFIKFRDRKIARSIQNL